MHQGGPGCAKNTNETKVTAARGWVKVKKPILKDDDVNARKPEN